MHVVASAESSSSGMKVEKKFGKRGGGGLMPGVCHLAVDDRICVWGLARLGLLSFHCHDPSLHTTYSLGCGSGHPTTSEASARMENGKAHLLVMENAILPPTHPISVSLLLQNKHRIDRSYVGKSPSTNTTCRLLKMA